jgi:hypothetical protein
MDNLSPFIRHGDHIMRAYNGAHPASVAKRRIQRQCHNI